MKRVQHKENHKVFDNIKMLDRSGEFLAYVGKSRMHYYIKNNLAKMIDDNCFQLLFQNKERIDDPYNGSYLKENKCVCCATTKYLTKHHIVPKICLKYIKTELKTKSKNRNTVAMCKDCHHEFERQFDIFKTQYVRDNCKDQYDAIKEEYSLLLSIACKAYAYCYCNIPNWKQAEIYDQLCQLTGNNLIYNQIQEFADNVDKYRNELACVDRLFAENLLKQDIGVVVKLFRNYLLPPMANSFPN